MESERNTVQRKTAGISIGDSVCPRCGCKTYYDLSPEIAWCWASGLIEFGEAAPAGSIVIASGAKSWLRTVVGALARQGKGNSAGKLLVPGIPEADGQKAAGDALATWLAWCAKSNGKKGRYGVVFAIAAKGGAA